MEQNKKNKNLVLLVLLRIVLIVTLCYCSLLYYEFNRISKEEKSIEYSIKSYKIKGSGRKAFGQIRIEYHEKEYKVEVKLEEYYKFVNEKEKPVLYYSQKRDIVFARIRINQFRAWAIVSGFFLLISLIPYGRISKKLDVAIEKKELKRKQELNRVNNDRK